MSVKRHIALLAGALVLTALSGCKGRGTRPPRTNGQGGPTTRAEDTLDKVRRTGVLRVVYVVYPPTVMRDPNTGEVTGHFVDMAEFLADVMGVKVEFVEGTWDTFVGLLQSGQADLSIAATYRTIPRAMAVAFTRPIIYIGNSAVVRKGDTRFKTVQDFNKEGLTLAVAQGEASHEYAREHFPDAKLVVLDTADLSRPLAEVIAGRADVGLADAWTVKQYAAEHSEVIDLFGDHPYDLTPVGWAVRPNDHAWLQFLNTAIDYMESTGRLEQWEREYDAHWTRPKVMWTTE